MFRGGILSDVVSGVFWSFLPPRFFCLSMLSARYVLVFSLGFRGGASLFLSVFLYRVSCVYSWSYLKQEYRLLAS